MERIKQIWYDSSVINSCELEERFRVLNIPFKGISKNNVMVCTELSAHALFDSLSQVVNNHEILIAGFDSNDYWGYMNGELWTWIKEHL